MNKNQMKQFNEQLQNFKLPRYNELPDIDLYMDQVISQLNKYLGDVLLPEGTITASMINNYVKLKLLPAPIKKRYSRMHLAHLIVITISKQVIAISQASHILQGDTEKEIAVCFDEFCTAQEKAISNMASILTGALNGVDKNYEIMRDAVATATANKMLAQSLLLTDSAKE